MPRFAFICGLAAPLIYLATVVIGGALTPGYSHLDQPVSALFQAGAPYALPVSAAFVAYNLALIGFALGLRRRLRWTAAMILLNGLLGLVIELFPMDPAGASVTAMGITHMVIAGGLVLTCALAMGLAILLTPRRVTIGLLIVMLVTGAIAAQAATSGWPPLGLFQRLTIGSYLVWIALLAMWTRPRSA